MGSRADIELSAVAERQYGLISLEQATAQGLSRTAINWRLASRSWVGVCRGVFRVAGAPATWKQTAFAAMLAAGDESALSHRTAAFLLGLDGVPREPMPVDATIARGHTRSLEGVAFHRTRVDFQRVKVGRFRLTSVARTLVDLSSLLSPVDLELALDSAQRRFHRVGEWLQRHLAQRNRHAPGVARLRELLAVRVGDAADSPLEVKVRRLLRRCGVERPTLRYEVFDGDGYVMRLDFAWPRHKVALHADSYRWHHQRERFERDARQRARLAALGWTSLTVTHLGLERRDWLHAVARVLGQRAPQLLLPLEAPDRGPRNHAARSR